MKKPRCGRSIECRGAVLASAELRRTGEFVDHGVVALA
jgi:hypothetical protein